MSRPSLFSAALTLALALAGPAQNSARKSAFDKSFLETYARHLFVIGPELTVQVLDPKPASDLPGFKEVTVRVSNGTANQDIRLLVSDDGSKVVQGNVYDVNSNPFKKDLDKVKTQGQPSFGTPGAPVVLVEFSDMQCPHCKEEAQMIRANLLKEFPTQVRFYFKDFPIASIHPWAKAAAMAGRCVFRQNPAGFWDYHDWIFERQESISPENLKDQVMGWAKVRKDIDALQLSRCIDDKATEKEVEANAAEGVALQVDGTPTLFVNGRRVPPTEWPELKLIINAEIAYQKTAKDAGEDCGCEIKLDAPGLPPTTAPILPLPKKK
ncbi:MAG: thioredoxin domain-containing protein [Bryobacteraceae bacterium]|jgi:protein-disulfide isomerase